MGLVLLRIVLKHVQSLLNYDGQASLSEDASLHSLSLLQRSARKPSFLTYVENLALGSVPLAFALPALGDVTT
jgi:hypothetical protein